MEGTETPGQVWAGRGALGGLLPEIDRPRSVPLADEQPTCLTKAWPKVPYGCGLA